MLMLVSISVLASVLVISCSNPERDEVIKFYRELYPISKEIHQATDEWNKWNMQAPQKEYQQNLYSKAIYYKDTLRALSYKVVVLYAPQDCRNLKDLTSSALNKGIESFSYAEEYALNPLNESYRLKAESSQLESNQLLGLAADEWDDILTRYKIKASEIVR
jgi:hypothetical protein